MLALAEVGVWEVHVGRWSLSCDRNHTTVQKNLQHDCIANLNILLPTATDDLSYVKIWRVRFDIST